MMVKHSLVMDVEEYFAVKNYLIKLNQQGKLTNDNYIQKFYKAFAIESSISLDRKAKLFDNPLATVTFSLDNDSTLLSTISLFCREQTIDQNKDNPQLAKAFERIKNYMSIELMDLFGL